MTVRIFRDVEEALSREVRRLTFFENRSISHTVLQDTFDPFTGETVQMPIEGDFYDSSADTKMIQYPHFFIELMKSKEDLNSGRVIPQYGKTQISPITTSQRAYEIVLRDKDGVIAAPGNEMTTGIFQIRKAQPGYFLRVFTGPNAGTYIIDTVTPSNTGVHSITVSGTLVDELPELLFTSTGRIVNFREVVDLNTVKIGDILEDASSNTFNILAINLTNNSIEIDGLSTPDLDEGGKITRSGDVFQSADPNLVGYSIMNPANPIQGVGIGYTCANYDQMQAVDPAVPLDLFYRITIDSKERDTHVDVANRIWEEFNPPRTGLPTIVRSAASNEKLLAVSVLTGGSNTLDVGANDGYSINDTVFVFHDLTPTKAVDGRGFQEVFTAKIIGLVGTNQIVLDKVVPDTFTVDKNTKVVSNAEYYIFEFHFVDHNTKNVHGAQYFVHVFDFKVQVWVNRQGTPTNYDGVVQQIHPSGEDMDGNVIIEC